MRRRSVVLRWIAIACLGTAGALAILLVWPSPRERTVLTLSGKDMGSAWVPLSPSEGTAEVSPVPDLTLRIDAPRAALQGREEELTLRVDLPAGDPSAGGYALVAQIHAVGATVNPPGESGQALRPGAAFEWTMTAAQARRVSATLLVRLQRHASEGTAAAERLLLARDLALPVRTVAGLAASGARLAASMLGLTGSVLAMVSMRKRGR